MLPPPPSLTLTKRPPQVNSSECRLKSSCSAGQLGGLPDASWCRRRASREQAPADASASCCATPVAAAAARPALVRSATNPGSGAAGRPP